MSQFQPNQQIELKYEGRKMFEEPLKPAVYQEQMPYLPTPSFKVGYSGFNLAQAGSMLAQAGSNVFEGYLKADAAEKNAAIESISMEADEKLKSLYKMGATDEELAKETAIAHTKITETLGYDPLNPEYDDGKEGLIPQRHILNSRKVIYGLKSQNDTFSTNNKASDVLTQATVASLAISETLNKNPNADIGIFDEGDATLSRILTFITGKDNATSSDIMKIESPQDKDLALRVYKAKVDLQNDKRQEVARRAKATADANKDEAALEKEQLKEVNDKIRDILREGKDRLEVISELMKAITDKGSQRTPEDDAQHVELIQQYVGVRDNLNATLSAYDQYMFGPNNISSSIVTYSNIDQPMFGPNIPGDTFQGAGTLVEKYIPRNMLDGTQSNRLIEASPESRTAYGELMVSLAKGEREFGGAVIKIKDDFQKKSVAELVDRNKAITAVIETDIAFAKSQDTFLRDKQNLLARVHNASEETLGRILPYIGEEKLQSIFNSVSILSAGGKPVIDAEAKWVKEQNQNFPTIRRLLSFDTPEDQFSRIQKMLGDNPTAMEAWLNAQVSHQKLQEKIFGTGEAGATSKKSAAADLERTLRELAGEHTPTHSVKEYRDAIDFMVIEAVNTNGQKLDPTKREDVRPILQNLAAQGKGISLEQMASSSLFLTMFNDAKDTNELLSMIVSGSQKDSNGGVVPSAPTPWAKSVSGSSSPAFPLIQEALNNSDPNSEQYLKAVAAYAILPPTWRAEMRSGLKQAALVDAVETELKTHPEKGILRIINDASSGGFSDTLITTAKDKENSMLKVVNPSVNILIAQTGSGMTSDQLVINKQLVAAVDAGIEKGFANPAGLPLLEGGYANYRVAGASIAEGYAIILGKTAKKFYLYQSLYPNDKQKAVDKATREAFQEYTADYAYRPRGHVLRANLPSDQLATDPTPLQISDNISNTRAYVGQSNNEAFFNQDIAGVMSANPNAAGVADTLIGYGIAKEDVKKALENPFGAIANSALISNDALSRDARNTWGRFWSPKDSTAESSELDMAEALIKAGRARSMDGTFNTQETTRKEFMIAVAAVKEAATSGEDFDSREQLLGYIRERAITIRKSLDDSGYDFNKETEYTFSIQGNGTIENKSAYSASILKKRKDGDGYTVVSTIKDGLNTVSMPGFATRGTSSNTQMLSSLSDHYLRNTPTEVLIPQLEKMYAKGLLVGDFQYKIIQGELPDKGEASLIRGGKAFDDGGIPILEIRYDRSTKKVSVKKTEGVSKSGLVLARTFSKKPYEPGYAEEQEFLQTADKQFSKEESSLDRVTPVVLPPTPQAQREMSLVPRKVTSYRSSISESLRKYSEPTEEATGAVRQLFESLNKSAIDPTEELTSELETKYENNTYINNGDKTARQFYESVYGPEITTMLFEQAMKRQKAYTASKYTAEGIPVRSRFTEDDYFTEVLVPYASKKYNKLKQENPQKENEDFVVYQRRIQNIKDEASPTKDPNSPYYLQDNTLVVDAWNEMPNYDKFADAPASTWSDSAPLSENRDPVRNQYGAEAFQVGGEKGSKPSVYWSNKLLKQDQRFKTIGIHEFTHVMQTSERHNNTRNPLSTVFFREALLGLSPDRSNRYAMSAVELPAWLAGLKAEYYQETKELVAPESSDEVYENFFAWLKEKDTQKQIKDKPYMESFYGIFHKMLTNPDPKIRTFMIETARQVAFDFGPQDNTTLT